MAWKVYFHTTEVMPEIADGTAQVAVASPPFTHNPDGKTLDKLDYTHFIERVFAEVCRVLVPGGVMVTVNTDLRDHARYNRGDKHFNGLVWHKHGLLRQVAEETGFACIDTKIWAKTLNRNAYRYTFAYIQFFKKPGGLPRHPVRQPLSPNFAPDIWLLEGGTYRQDSRGFVFRDAIHPEIVRRCIEQFTLPGDLVLSPFTGSGTILSVANRMGRECIGYEINRALELMIAESVEAPEKIPIYQR